MARNIMKIYSVQECSQFLTAAIQKSYIFRNITVRGTIAGWHRHFSGVTFFSLIDGSRRISCFIGRMHQAFLTRHLESGLEVSCVGDLKYDAVMGRPVLHVNRVLAIGQSVLQEKKDALFLELESRGFFDPSHKKALPTFPFHIGIVTSGSGAVIHDIMKTGRMRNPFVRYSLYSSAVQGEGAAEELAEAVSSVSSQENVPDVLIIARGGGAEEDLSTFNEKVLLEAVHACPLPVVSAVGHETDTTFLDLVADVRASTPTQAAEIAIPERDWVLGQIQSLVDEITREIKVVVTSHRQDIHHSLAVLSSGLIRQPMRKKKEDVQTLCLDMKNQVQRKLSDGYKETGQAMLQLLQQEKWVYHE